MSYMQAARPYGNGDTNGADPRLGRFDFDTTPETSADERSRSRGPGGYGGFGTQHQLHAPAHLDRQYAHRRSTDDGHASSRSRSRGAPAPRVGGRGNDVEEILRYISQHWPFMADESCVPVKVALQLNDPSSLGLADQYDQFQAVHRQLQNALKGIVNEHHQAFNSSIGTFHNIQAAIQSSQHRVRTLRAGLTQAKASLSTAKPELRASARSSQAYDRMLVIVNDIETLQAVPDALDAQIGEKRFLGAVATLQEALGMIRKPEMEDIGALTDLRLYLGNQEQFLADHLVEELCNHLYLKSPYTESRWKAHAKRERNDSAVSLAVGGEDEDAALYSFLESFDGSTPMTEDPTRNPEADSFYYISMLVESLRAMGRLDVAIDEIDRRLPVELFKVVERSHGEVEQRHLRATMRTASARARQHSQAAVAGAAKLNSEQQDVLEDLLRTLYARFEAVAEGHRVLHEVTVAILKRDQTSSEDATTLSRSFRELWKVLQSEIRSLLHDHLTFTSSSSGLSPSQRTKDNDPNAHMFRSIPRDKNKKLFRIADTTDSADRSSNTDTAIEKEDLMNMLKDSVPGLVNTSQASKDAHDRETADRRLAEKSATGHKLLVEPSVFNMSILLPPSLAFLHRLEDIVPTQGSGGLVARTLTSFLDDFLMNVFHPQLDETLIELCARATEEAEAWSVDPGWRDVSSRPVFRGTVRMFEVVESVCGLLRGLPHEMSFSSLVIGALRGYYDRCYGWSKGLLQQAGAEGQGMRMKLAADLATSGDVNAVVIEMLGVTKDGNEEREMLVLAEKESALLLQDLAERKVEESDLIAERKALAALATLHMSMKWLAARCASLRYLSPHAIDLGGEGTEGPDKPLPTRQSKRWTNHMLLAPPQDEPAGPYLPLDTNMAARFDAVIVSFNELGALILRTLRLDLRLQVLHGVAAACGHTYALGEAYNDPDPAILSLSTNLSAYDTAISTRILQPQYDFLTGNLHVLLNASLTSHILLSHIPALDAFGLARAQLNILVLQQAIKSLEPAGSLHKAAEFWALAERGCDAIVNEGRNLGYATADLEVLLRLAWDEERDGKDGVGAAVDVYVGRLNASDGAGGSGASFPKRGASLRRQKR